MGQFKYTAISRGGEKVSGVIDGYNELDAATRIKQSCDVILKLTDVSDKGPGFLNLEVGAGKLNAKAFTVMCSQFAIILKAGVPLSRAVRLIADKTADKPLEHILKQAGEDVEAGRSLSAALADHGKKLLPQTFIETIRAGEESGKLDESFRTMHTHFDKQNKTRAKVRGAMAYPLFVLVIAVIVVIVLMVKVVPVFTDMFAEAGAELPGAMRLLMTISGFFRNNILILAAAVAAAILGLTLYGNTENGRLRLARVKLKLPVLGNINLLTAASQFANTMAAMMAAGLPLSKAVSITAKVIDNYYIAQETGKLTGELEQGRSLGASMREQGVMPDILTDMVGVGEDTGELTETLDTIAEFYDNELEEAVKAALAKLEPALLISIAVVAGFIVITMYTTMFSMYSAIG